MAVSVLYIQMKTKNILPLKILWNETILTIIILTILTGKKCVLFNSVQEWFVASDLFDMFTQSIKFYYTFYYDVLRVQMFEKCDSSNRQ